MKEREIVSKNLQEAYKEAVEVFSVDSVDCLDIKILSSGSKGFLGIGFKPVRILVKLKIVKDTKIVKEVSKKDVNWDKAEGCKEVYIEKPVAIEKEPFKEARVEKSFNKSGESSRVKNIEQSVKNLKEEKAKLFVSTCLKEIGADFDISSRVENSGIYINITSNVSGIIIGKRGFTLDSLQFLTSLAVNKSKEDYLSIHLDCENYRSKREDVLVNLAKNLAKKVVATKKTVILEPMSSNERRIIHDTLSNNSTVETFSEGKDKFRHVVIKLKRSNFQ